MRVRPLVLAIGFFVASPFVACKPRGTSPPPVSDAAPVNDARHDPRTAVDAAASPQGAALYASLCAVCHGENATGYKADNAPSLVNPTFLESATDEHLRRSIVDGRPGTSMAAYGKERGGPLADEDVRFLVQWLRAHGEPPRRLPPVPAGDAKHGAALYGAHCVKCHGTREARGSAVDLTNERFLDVASDRFLSWAIGRGRPGTPMEAWDGKLAQPEIDDLVAYLRSFQKAAEVSSLPAPTGKEPLVINPNGRHPAFKPRSTPCAPGVPCTPDARFVSVDDVKKALDEKRRMIVIDARPPSDWMRVHIPGAVSIPYHDLTRLEEVPKDGTWVIAYCACPHHLSGDVVNALRKRGVAHAVVLDEGILEWHRRGYPVVAAPGVEPPGRAPPAR